MKSRSEYQFIVVLIFASIALALVSMVSLSSIRLGLDFGKDTRIIVGVEDEKQFLSFVDDLQFNKSQTRLRVSGGDIFILDVSGVESGEDFEKHLLAENPTATIILSGTFGSMTKFINNQSFVMTCIFLFIVLLGVYYIVRYHFAGWYYWLISSLSLLIPLIFSSSLGIAFTQTMWYAFFIAFLTLYFLNTVSYDENRNVFITVFASFIFTGLILMYFVQFPYFSGGFYLFSFGVVSSVLYYLHGKYFAHLLADYLKDRTFPISDLFEVEDSKSVIISRFLSVILIVVLLGGMLAISRGTPLLNSVNNQDTVLIFNRSDSSTYLEVQARLSKLDLFDKQINYSVSEQGQTWLAFDDSVTIEDLDILANDLSLGLDLSVKYYQTSDGELIDYNWTYFAFVGGLAFVFMLVIYDRKSLKYSIGYAVLLVLNYGIFILFTSLFGFSSDYSWLFVALYLPLILLLVLLSFITEKAVTYRRFFVENLISTVTAFLLMCLPVLVIFPISQNAQMMLMFLVMFLSIYTSLGILSMRERKDD